MNVPIYLTDVELFSITGFKQKSHQIKWLTENHVHHYVNRLGKPIVIRTTICKYNSQANTDFETPDFGALTNGKETQRS
ncbi:MULTISPECIES: DUF4224 domain-containing protein [Photorhabdus]|uniref:DUF4224 domain-containing protein n=1 Tax=Photorhabdus TaxID=29487 RepID=UPI0002E7DA84|nr:DUF4224 domain-containing protein [Photorhabdus asymbiotica]